MTTQTDTTSRASHLMVDPNNVLVVGIDPTGPNGEVAGPEHPLYDPRITLPISRELVENIKLYGVITTVTGKADGDRILTVDGRRRVIHSRIADRELREAGMPGLRIPVLVKKGDDQRMFGTSRAANACRVDDSPIVNAKNAQRMLDMGAPESTVAVTFGVKLDTVKEWLRLLDTSPEVQAQLHTGALPVNAGLALASLPASDQTQVMADIVSTNTKPTAENVTNLVRARQGKAATQTPKTRIERACTVLEQLARLAYTQPDGQEGLPQAALLECINKLSLAVMSTSFAKVCKATAKSMEDESTEASEKAAKK